MADGLSRAEFLDAVERRCAHEAAVAEPFGLVLVRLNHLKQISHAYGYQVGDALLQAQLGRLAAAARPQDLVGHLGGSTFALLLGPPCGESMVELAINRMLSVIEEPIHVSSTRLSCKCHGAGVLFPEHGQTASALLALAEKSLDRARTLGKPCVTPADEVPLAPMGDFHILESMEYGIAHHEFELHYQPQIELESGVVHGIEALVRWNSPSLGHVPPARFIPLLELSDMILPLTRWILNTALRDYRKIAALNSGLTISVNLSAPLLTHPELIDTIGDALAIWGMPPERLMIEITETAMLHQPEASIESLHRLRKFGALVSIDDFGTGYSSLSHLEQLPTDELKVDMSFVRRMSESEHDRKIVRAVIDLAHTFEMKVVAEGIEHAGIAEILRGYGCDFGQGNYFSKPLTQAELLGYLVAHRAR